MRQAVFVLAIGLAACGGGTPTSPSGTPSSGTSLSSGRYSLSVTTSTSGQEPFFQACLSIRVGNPVGSMPVPASTFVVIAADDGAGGFTLRLEDPFDPNWTMTLRQSGSSVEGLVKGTARDILIDQTVNFGDGGSVPGAARLTGSVGFNRSVAGGQVSGRVAFERPGWSYSCANNDWILNRIAQ